MRIKDYFLTPDNLPRIRRLGFLRFVAIYSVLPVTTLGTAFTTTYKWLTTRHTIYSNILDFMDLAKHNFFILFPFSIVIGSVMWWHLVLAEKRRQSPAPCAKPSPRWRPIGFLAIGMGAGIGLGVSVGVWLHREMIAPWEDNQIAYAAAWYHELSARDLYLNGEYSAGKNALLDHIRVLERIRNRESGGLSFSVSKSEIAFCYVRLSLLEEQHGESQAAEDYWEAATTQLRNAGWADTSRGKVLCALKARDLELPTGVAELP